MSDGAFSYEGYEIRVNGDGEFEAEVNGTVLKRANIKSLHKAIKEMMAIEFKPFTGLSSKLVHVTSGGGRSWQTSDTPAEAYTVLHVIGFERTKNRTHATHVFRIAEHQKKSEDTHWGYRRDYMPKVYDLIKDTPANRKALTDILGLRRKRQKAIEEFDAKEEKLRNTIDAVSVTDFVKEI